jgi:MEDS: MEthanogen/methylotroph, DcmR Sensory domain
MNSVGDASPAHGRTFEHSIQLFDTSRSRADRVAEYLREGARQGEQLLAVLTPAHWALVAERLREFGVPPDLTTVVDAAALLDEVVRAGQPDAPRFDDAAGGLVRLLASEGRGLRVYGEMVDLLAARGDFMNAERLERLWNDLARRTSFSLFCGYAAVHFGDARSDGVLRHICAAHAHVHAHATDDLGSWLVRRVGAPAPSGPLLA